MKEVGLKANHTSTPKTHKTCVDKTNDQLISSHGNTILTHVNIFLNFGNKCLASIYWLYKLYKSPAMARFIISAEKCSLKPLPKFPTSVFKLMFNKLIDIISKVFSFEVLRHSRQSAIISFSFILLRFKWS